VIREGEKGGVGGVVEVVSSMGIKVRGSGMGVGALEVGGPGSAIESHRRGRGGGDVEGGSELVCWAGEGGGGCYACRWGGGGGGVGGVAGGGGGGVGVGRGSSAICFLVLGRWDSKGSTIPLCGAWNPRVMRFQGLRGILFENQGL